MVLEGALVQAGGAGATQTKIKQRVCFLLTAVLAKTREQSRSERWGTARVRALQLNPDGRAEPHRTVTHTESIPRRRSLSVPRAFHVSTYFVIILVYRRTGITNKFVSRLLGQSLTAKTI